MLVGVRSEQDKNFGTQRDVTVCDALPRHLETHLLATYSPSYLIELQALDQYYYHSIGILGCLCLLRVRENSLKLFLLIRPCAGISCSLRHVVPLYPSIPKST